MVAPRSLTLTVLSYIDRGPIYPSLSRCARPVSAASARCLSAVVLSYIIIRNAPGSLYQFIVFSRIFWKFFSSWLLIKACTVVKLYSNLM